MARAEPPRFIAIEGGEGAGKTTQIRLLADYLKASGHDVVTTREPGGTASGMALRKLLLTGEGAAWTPMAETLLMMADRVQHVERVIRPALAAGSIVISDRYVLSTLAYQGAGRGLAVEDIFQLHRMTTRDLWPALTLVIDLDPAVGLARSRKRLARAASEETKFEDLGLDFHERVHRAFRSFCSEMPNVTCVDGSGSVDTIADRIRVAIDKALAE